MSRNRSIPDANPEFLEAMLERWRTDPASVAPEWHDLFAELGEVPDPRHPAFNGAEAVGGSGARLQTVAQALVRAYRERGHIVADFDPLGLSRTASHPDLEPSALGLSESDLDATVDPNGLPGFGRTTLSGLVARLREIYCGTLSAEFMHLDDPAPRAWLMQAMESGTGAPEDADRLAIFRQILRADVFERFMQTKFPTAKRWGMEGSEAQLPLAEQLLAEAANAGIDEIVIGPMHRGRTTFMGTFMQKPLPALFAEFQGRPWHAETLGIAGDVPYHMGRTLVRDASGHSIRISMCDHPSHVETVIPVALGRTRARRRLRGAGNANRVLGLMMHTDAGFAGQGIVAECFQLSAVPGYETGGSIHVIANNQIGFTTEAGDARSSRYCSDMGKIVQAPVLRVNGDDPEAAFRAGTIAVRFWHAFGRDIIIDFVCYRRQGHNELDEPRYTQPGTYNAVERLPTLRARYGQALRGRGLIDEAREEAQAHAFKRELEAGLEAADGYSPNAPATGSAHVPAADVVSEDRAPQPDTGVAPEALRDLSRRMQSLPEGFALHRNLARQIDERTLSVEEGENINWATAELLALASLLVEGTSIRLTGEDTVRGTFSQRHAVLVDQRTGARHTPLNTLEPGQALFDVFDSPLSEEAVLGFEYGYCITDPESLVLWEAQFGDFANVAQTFIDHFISCGEEKWLTQCGLVLLLPHGLEGGGLEHSTARPERFLQLCARGNMQVVNCTTPANHFHVLRRQLKRDHRKPLVALTPKRMLRLRAAVSNLRDFSPSRRFAPLISEPRIDKHGALVKRLILCSGRLYYDLDEVRTERRLENVAIVRIEELYPFPFAELAGIFRGCPNAEIVWCQEEPRNMGAFEFANRRIEEALALAGRKRAQVRYAGRPASPVPAAASRAAYEHEQQAVIYAGLGC